MIFISPIAGAYAQKAGTLRMATLSIGVAMICMISYGFIDSIWWLCLPLLIHACADAFTMPATQLAVTEASGENAIAAGQGLFGATGMLVGAVTAGAGGIVYQHHGAAALWWVATFAMFVLMVFAWWRGSSLRST